MRLGCVWLLTVELCGIRWCAGDEAFVEYTKSICPVCKVVGDAQVNIRDNKAYLRKRCREHGQFEALVYGDAQAYWRRRDTTSQA